MPDSASSVSVPADSLLPVTAQMPVLGAQITDLCVGHGSTAAQAAEITELRARMERLEALLAPRP